MSSELRRSGVTARKVLLVGALLVLAAWLVPSFISAERYRRRLEGGLQQTLKRPVSFGAVSFRLLPHLGFAIDNVLVREDPRFGSEPFAHVERIDCDLRWWSLLRSRLDFSRLHLDHPTLNVVRNAQGEWNVASLLRESGIASPAAGLGLRPPQGLALDVDGARIDFKIGDDKKPWAVTDLRAQLNFDPARGLLRYRVIGTPVRTDLSPPTSLSPGAVEVEGDWTPGRDLDGPLNVAVRARKSLLYDWVPLLSNRNPGIYGVMDLTANLTGSLRVLTAEGDCEVGQFYRWDMLPPSDSTPLRVRFRGELDRRLGQVVIEGADVAFGDSQLHVSGSVSGLFAAPEVNLVFAVGRSRLEDLLVLGRRFWTGPSWLNASGVVDGLAVVQGPWPHRRYGGLLTARGVRLNLPSGPAVVSDAVLRLGDDGVRLAPVKVTLAPHLDLVVEGAAGYAPVRDEPRPRSAATGRPVGGAEPAGSEGPGLPQYEVTASAKSWPLRDLVRLARAAGAGALQGIEATNGTATARFRFDVPAWPPKRPSVEGRVEVEAARLVLPGLSEPLGVPHAVVRVNGDQIVAFPLVATLGGNTFTGHLEHDGDLHSAWKFDLGTDKLSLEQGALWFEAFGQRTAPASILDLLPGLRSFDARRVAASNLFGALNAEGLFHASVISYRSLSVAHPEATVEVSGRVVKVRDATFRAAGGRGRAALEVDLAAQPALVRGSVALEESALQTLAPWLPASLRGLHGSASGSARFETRGLTRPEIAARLEGDAAVKLKDVSFGDFDVLDALVEQCHWGTLEPSRRRGAIRSATVTLRVRDRRVMLKSSPIELAGARIDAVGSYSFDGRFDVGVHTDFTHLARRWQVPASATVSPSLAASNAPAGIESEGLLANAHLVGPLDKLEVVPGAQATRSGPRPD